MTSDRQAVLFSLKCFAAAMLAYYIALRIGLPRPYWAVATAYIVSQPWAGASVSRGVFRLWGTIVGAAASVLLVPTLANEPLVLTLAFSVWIGLCLYLSLIDRTPRAYAFVLAGYTASLIGFSSVTMPGEVFNLAIVRVQEIGLGSLCGGLVHSLILPQSVADAVIARAAAIIGEAERWSCGALQGARDPDLERDRRRLAVDLLDLHQMSLHLPFDAAHAAPPRARVLQALHDRLSVALPLGAAIEDRLAELRAHPQGAPADVTNLIARVRKWLATQPTDAVCDDADDLMAAAQGLERPLVGQELSWRGLLLASLLSKVGALVAAHRDARLLQARLLAAATEPAPPHIEALIRRSRGYVLHRDHWLAGRVGVGAAVGLALGCAFWILTAWADGGTAITIMGALSALFGNVDAPAANVMRFLIGSLLGAGLGLLYSFVILPHTTDFVAVVAVLAPAMLFLGSMQARPALTFVALGAVLTFVVVAVIAETNATDFAAALNTALAINLGAAFAVASVTLFQTIGADQSIARLLRAGRSDVADRARGEAVDTTRWTNRMLDRTAMLVPRLAGRGRQLEDALADLRTGYAAGELRALSEQASAPIRRRLGEVLSDVAAHYRRQAAATADSLDPSLLANLDEALTSAADEADGIRRRALVLLTDLRRELFPQAPDFRAVTQ